MNRVRRRLKPASILMLILLSLLVIPYQPVLAAMVGTEEILRTQQGQPARDRVQQFLDREDVRSALMAQGIDPREAKSRVGSLSDTEVASLADKIDSLPAGGDALGLIVGTALLVFIILLITDILGFTDVFSFVKKHR
jgi:hypothetical protein